MKNSAALKTLATSSRLALINQMQGLVKQLLNNPKAAAEYPREVDALRRDVDLHGEGWVADTAAYTWFNRLTAARYMDARGFSGVYAVVSPAPGSSSALPEVLLRAQAGDFSDAVPGETRTAVTDLLTGRRTSADPDAEAYALLLSAIFRSWHEPMPEVFPATVDWIRLLTPTDLLAPTSVRARAVEVMDVEVCESVEVVGWLYQFYNADLKEKVDKSKSKIDATNVAPKTQLFTPDYIVRYLVENSLGRLWLRSRPSSLLRDDMTYFVEPVAEEQDTGVKVASPEEIRIVDPACGSGHMLTYAFDLMFRIYEEEGYTPSSIPQLILARNLRGLEIDERAAQLASFALAMKARAKDRRFFTRRDENDMPVQPDIVRIAPLTFDDPEVQLITGAVSLEDRSRLTELVYSFRDADTFGSLIRVDDDTLSLLTSAIAGYEDPDAERTISSEIEYLLMGKVRALGRQARALADRQYHVVVANPPYLGSGNMGPSLSSFAKAQYPTSRADLCAMFIERNSEIAAQGGSVAMVTKDSWMFISSYKNFRTGLPSWGHLVSMAHLGTRGFDSINGDVVRVTAFVLDVKRQPEWSGVYIRLVDGGSEAAKNDMMLEVLADQRPNLVSIADMKYFDALPDYVMAYWITPRVRSIFENSPGLGEDAAVRCGMNTGDNASFVRSWWEPTRSLVVVDARTEADFRNAAGLWCPYNKGGETRRWWGNQSHVLRYDADAIQVLAKQGNHLPSRDLYFKKSVSWSKIGGSTFRRYPSGFVFDGAGMSIFAGDSVGLDSALALLNSSTGEVFLEALAPTLNVQSGDVANFPTLPNPNYETTQVIELISISRNDWNDYETSWGFENNPLVVNGTGTLEAHAKVRWDDALAASRRAQDLEEQNNRHFAALYELEDEVECAVPFNRISLTQNPYFRYAPTKDATRTDGEYRALFDSDLAKELISYAVGCMMGRYSLDKPGLVLADAGATLADFDAVVPGARFYPDSDGIIPITSEHYFEDDIVARLREFLKVAFGPENVESNVSWLEFALGSGKRKPLRQYFLKNFYDDHLQMYSKRPIYWQVSSNPKTDKGFNALFYLHRYTPATLGLIRQGYANELIDKQQARLETIEHALPSAGKAEATKLSKERDVLTAQQREIKEWITTKLFPLSTAEVVLDLDDGVKQNYPKLNGVVRKVSGL